MNIFDFCQLILKEESYFHQVIDPSSGSYVIESLTDQLIEIGIVKRLDSPNNKLTDWITEQMRHLMNNHAI